MTTKRIELESEDFATHYALTYFVNENDVNVVAIVPDVMGVLGTRFILFYRKK